MTKIAPFSSDRPAGRRRCLALGAHYAAACAEIAARGLPAALEAVDLMGGATQRMQIARDLVAAVRRAGTVPGCRVERAGRRITVLIPSLTWRHRNRRQRGVLEWLPVDGWQPASQWAPHRLRPLATLASREATIRRGA